MKIRCLVAAAIFVLCGSSSGFAEVILAEHTGANDPLTEGWVRQRPFGNVFTFPVVNDLGSGIDAWAVDDNGTGVASEGLYFHGLTPQQGEAAMQNGWRLTGTLRVADTPTPQPNGSVVINVFTPSPDPRAFGISLGSEADGSPLFRFGGQLAIVLDLDDLDDGYHTYELLFDPSDETADLFVDNVLRYEGWAGVPTVQPLGVSFGTGGAISTGQGNYSFIQLSIVPEPSSVALWCLMGLALGGYGYRRMRRK